MAIASEITADEAIKEWNTDREEASTASVTDPTSMKHLCTCCYLKGKKDYMLDAYQLAISKATDFYDKYASQCPSLRGLPAGTVQPCCRE